MLQVSKLSKRFGSRLVFRDVSLEIPFGSVAAIVGSNGAGKSTLLKIIGGLMRASSGEFAWRQEHSGCGLFAPDAPVYRELSVEENLEFFARALPASTPLQDQLKRFQLMARRQQMAGDLSSGWRARLQLAVATLGAPRVLLLDEPSSHLDSDGLAILAQLLEAQRECGIALVATNDAREAARCDLQISL
jgi:ABC-type multidrug transport system ATPase subunit